MSRSPASPASPTQAGIGVNPDAAETSPPWWRLPIVWMVIAGPAIVVVASFTTLALAILNPDPVLEVPQARVAGEVPAMQARNHAAAPRP